MHVLLLAAILCSALYQANGAAYPLSSSDRLALRSYLRDALLSDFGDTMADPATREESAANNKLIIPPNTFVSGGAGEGKQRLGSTGKIPNKQVAIPEVHAGYSTPPNPCPKTMNEDDKESVQSVLHPRLTCFCEAGWEDVDGEVDCTTSDQCCLSSMSNTAAFVSQYQETGEAAEQQYMPYKRNMYVDGEKRSGLVAKKSPETISKRSLSNRRYGQKRSNPYLDNQPLIDGVVAKKSPSLSGFPAM